MSGVIAHRIKLYRLNEKSCWDDLGVGMATLTPLETDPDIHLLVRAEQGHLLLQHKLVIKPEESPYDRQGDTILTWTEEEKDYAMSFENLAGILAMWRSIMMVQGRPESEILALLAPNTELNPNEMDSAADTPLTADEMRVISGAIDIVNDPTFLNTKIDPASLAPIPEFWTIPFPTESTLPLIKEKITAAVAGCINTFNKMDLESKEFPCVSADGVSLVEPYDQKDLLPLEWIVSQVTAEGYINKIYDIFTTADDLEAMQELQCIYEIVLQLLMCNNGIIFEHMLSDENLMKTIACLEYDPKTSGSGTTHRDFFKSSKLIQVVPLKEGEMIAKIHQTHRLTYLNDVILLNKIDENTATSLQHVIYYNNVWIVSTLLEDKDFPIDLFSLMANPEKSWNEKRPIFQFFLELFQIGKTLPFVHRSSFYNMLSQNKLFRILELALLETSPNTEEWLWLQVGELLLSVSYFDSSMLRVHLLERTKHFQTCSSSEVLTIGNINLSLKSSTFLSPTIDLLTGAYCNIDTALINLYSELTRSLFEFEIINIQHPQPPSKISVSDKSTLLSILFEQHLSKIISCLSLKSANDLAVDQVTKYCCLEFMFALINEHSQQLKPYIQRFRVLEVISDILNWYSRQQVVLAAIRVFRLLICLADEFYLKRILQSNMLVPIINLLISNGSRYNVMNSAIMHILEFVRAKNIKSVLTWLISEYGEKFKELHYVPIFDQLIQRHAQNIEYEKNPDIVIGPAAPPVQVKVPIDHEAVYFESEFDIPVGPLLPVANLASSNPHSPSNNSAPLNEVNSISTDALDMIDNMLKRKKDVDTEEDSLSDIIARRSPSPSFVGKPLPKRKVVVILPTIKPRNHIINESIINENETNPASFSPTENIFEDESSRFNKKSKFAHDI